MRDCTQLQYTVYADSITRAKMDCAVKAYYDGQNYRASCKSPRLHNATHLLALWFAVLFYWLARISVGNHSIS